jgi:hypothetical protein
MAVRGSFIFKGGRQDLLGCCVESFGAALADHDIVQQRMRTHCFQSFNASRDVACDMGPMAGDDRFGRPEPCRDVPQRYPAHQSLLDLRALRVSASGTNLGHIFIVGQSTFRRKVNEYSDRSSAEIWEAAPPDMVNRKLRE